MDKSTMAKNIAFLDYIKNYTKEDFLTFVSKTDMEVFSPLISLDKKFRDILFCKSYLSYEIHELTENIKEGPNAGMAPYDNVIQLSGEEIKKRKAELEDKKDLLTNFEEHISNILNSKAANNYIIDMVNVSYINDIIDNLKHPLVSDGRTNYIKNNVTHISKEEALYSLNSGIKIGYRDTIEDYHGTWAGYYQYHPVLSVESLLRNTKQISIDPVYDFVKTSVKSKNIKEMLSAYIMTQEKEISRNLRKSNINPTKSLVTKIIQLNEITKKNNNIKDILEMKQQPGSSPENNLLKEIKSAMYKQQGCVMEYY